MLKFQLRPINRSIIAFGEQCANVAATMEYKQFHKPNQYTHYILLKWNKCPSLDYAKGIKTHFLWDCHSVNCTSWEQLYESAPKTELMQYASYRRPKTVKGKVCADLLTSSSMVQILDVKLKNARKKKKGEKRKSPSWELFDCLPWPSYWLPITPSIISQLHQRSKANQQGGSHKMTSAHQIHLAEPHCNIFHLAHRWGKLLWCRLISAQPDHHSLLDNIWAPGINLSI